MRRTQPEYAGLALQALESAGVRKRMQRAFGKVVVVERMARAAGATNWFILDGTARIPELTRHLSPGSCVSFYFDDRLRLEPYDQRVGQGVLDIARSAHEAVVGALLPDGLSVETELVANKEELDGFVRNLPSGANVLYGAFPARDNDYENAITIDLPDSDGTARRHPH